MVPKFQKWFTWPHINPFDLILHSFVSTHCHPSLCQIWSFSLQRLPICRDCNPGLLFQSRDFGIEKCQSRDPGIESRDWVPVSTSKNFLYSLVLVLWWVLESWSICWSPVLTYFYVNNCKYFYLSSFLSYDTISPLFNVKLNFYQDSRSQWVFFVFKVVKIVKFNAII